MYFQFRSQSIVSKRWRRRHPEWKEKEPFGFGFEGRHESRAGRRRTRVMEMMR